jgi:hypothetical protein
MSLVWTDGLAGVDWDELEALYRAAPRATSRPPI